MPRNKRTLVPAPFLFFSIVCLTVVSSTTQALAGSTGKAPSPHPAALEEAIKLKQTHFFMGDSEVTIAVNGIRIQNTGQLKYTLVAKAPEWRIYVYRTDDKTYFTESLAEFEQTGLMSNFLFPFKEVMLNGRRYQSELLTIDGFKVIQTTSPEEQLRYMDLGTLPHQIKRIIYVAYKLPTNRGIPIKYVYHVSGVDMVTRMDRKHEIEIALDTTTMKRVKISPHEFEMPPQLKQIKSMREVVAGDSTRSESEDAKALLGM